MSGKPYPAGVVAVLGALEQAEQLRNRIVELTPLVQELRESQAKLDELSVKVADLLNNMDLESQGNFGFGGRMGWFVAEMRRQILASAKGEPASGEKQP